ncbi:MAG: undecaprenyldiphospho-muramoylpentapeptide beta-N-acetylglucosaminyltransferase [Pseudomonadota bacterium]
MNAPIRVLIAAGGTGGHVFPALAVAEELRAGGASVGFLGTAAGLEARVVPAAGFPLGLMQMAGLRGKGVGRWLAAPWLLLRAIGQARAFLRREAPQVVLGMGGFVSGPAGLAARSLGVPLLIHEQNAVPGYANRLLARVAQAVLTGFPIPTLGRSEWVGNPVRAAIAALPVPEARLAGRTGAPHLLVMGGSLGARDLNRVLLEAMARLAPAERPLIWHQTGQKHFEEVQRAYAEAGVEARVEPFIEDVAAALAWADLALCRAGALTIAELACAGLGAILVPYPHAVDDHQAVNAEFLVKAGAARVIRQEALNADSLLKLLMPLLRDPQVRLRMATAARAQAKPAAAQAVAQACRHWAMQHAGGGK